MIINIHAGHNPDGQIASGAIGLLKESTEARIVKDLIMTQLRRQNNTVYDCTVNNGISQKDVLNKIVKKSNSNMVDLDVSIHFNSGVRNKNGNGIITGTEAYVYSDETLAYEKAKSICNAISSLGFKNRGVKINKELYVLKNTIAPAVLIECCFVDDKDDVELYNSNKMARAIVEGITGKKAEIADVIKETKPVLYRVQSGAYVNKENAENLKKKLQEAGFDSFITSA